MFLDLFVLVKVFQYYINYGSVVENLRKLQLLLFSDLKMKLSQR